jgi:hypothetical protein
MPVEVIVVTITIAKVPIVVIPRKFSVVKVASGVGIAAGNVATGDSSTSVVGAAIHVVTMATLVSHAAAIATSVHVAAIATSVHVTAIAAAIVRHVAAIPTATILATATATIAATPAVSDESDCAAVS